jgi:DNA-binding CsgD family transcriptional regulator
MGSSAYARARETIVRICRGEADVRMLRLEALDAIRRAVSFDAYAWLLTDPETLVGSSPLARMDANATTPAAARRDVAVSIEPSTAGDRVTVFGRACGLTPREAELLLHLAGGATTREVARQMFVSENTIQDHLKSIFDKSTARSRRALLARALGT